MKELLSEAGQCLVYGIIFVLLIMGFYGIFVSVTVNKYILIKIADRFYEKKTRGILWNSLYQNMVELL